MSTFSTVAAFHSVRERSHRQGSVPYYGASGIIDHIDDFIFDEDLILVGEDGANLVNRSTPLAFIATGKYWVNNHAHILRPHDQNLVFWNERIEAIDFTPFVTGSAQPKLTIDALANVYIAAPPDPHERKTIADYVVREKSAVAPLLDEAEIAIKLLYERRSALIAAAVTGKIDLRGRAPAHRADADRESARLVISAEIIERLSHKPTFGRVKLQKLAYLTEAHADVSELAGNYLREAAGPLDRDMIAEMETQLKRAGHVSIDQASGAGGQVTYQVCGHKGAHLQQMTNLLGDRLPKFTQLIADLGDLETKSVEAVATLYAVWNDALLDGKMPTDDAIVSDVLNDWHPEKAEKFKPTELHTWLGWMRRHGLVPKGKPPRTSTGRLFP